MTEKKLHEKLMSYKSQYGLTKEVLQHYQWALETLSKQQPLTKLNKQEPPIS